MLNMTDIRKHTGLNRAEFCRRYSIPYKTMSQWEHGVSHAPSWYLELFNRYLSLMDENNEQKTQIEELNSMITSASRLSSYAERLKELNEKGYSENEEK